MRSRGPGVLLCLLWLLVAVMAQTPARAQAPAPPTVASVAFVGRVNVPEETVREAVKLQAGQPFTAAQMEADRRALLALGYFRSVAAAQRTENGQAAVTFRLVEWPRVVHIRVLGNTVVERAAIQAAITTQLGQVLRAPQLQEDVRAIERLYREHGYVARVSEKLLDEAARSGILRFEILELQIADVQVEGGTPALQERIRAALTEVAPQLYRPEAVARDQQRLLQLRGVRSATARVEALEPGKVRIRWMINAAAAAG